MKSAYRSIAYFFDPTNLLFELGEPKFENDANICRMHTHEFPSRAEYPGCVHRLDGA